jgi:omega-amidase
MWLEPSQNFSQYRWEDKGYAVGDLAKARSFRLLMHAAKMKAPILRSFNLALIQLGGLGTRKSNNLKHARQMILAAANAQSKPKPDLVILPVRAPTRRLTLIFHLKHCQECFNSPYGHTHFPVYAESIGYTAGEPYDTERSSSESVKMLSAAAKEVGVWLIGGSHFQASPHAFF